MIRNIKLTIEYDGTDFNGWQIQSAKERSVKTRRNSNKLRTVQGTIEQACQKVFKERIRLIGSGRTDSGVHALGQVANFKTNSRLTPKEIVRAINASLPDDVSIVDAQDVPDNFHAQYSVKSKIYRYTILNRPAPPAINRDFYYFFPYKLNTRAMRQELKTLVGRKNFKSFQASDAKRPQKKAKDTVRHIKQAILKVKSDFITIDIEADGFLYKMVRNIVGTLIEIGKGKIPKGSISKILAKKNRLFAAQTAKAKGLCLLKVKY